MSVGPIKRGDRVRLRDGREFTVVGFQVMGDWFRVPVVLLQNEKERCARRYEELEAKL